MIMILKIFITMTAKEDADLSFIKDDKSLIESLTEEVYYSFGETLFDVDVKIEH